MAFRTIRSRLVLGLGGIVMVASGCASAAIPATSSPEFTKTVPSLPSSTAVAFTTGLTPVPTETMFPTPTLQAIVVTAAKGNVFIRRGPDLAYDAVSVLMDGQSVKALARDVLAKWLQITIPGHPEKTGWISIQTHFVSVSGEVMSLPEITPADWPVLASLRNCTNHLMVVDPGGILIPAVDNFPENDVQINPGIYTIHDGEVDGSPEVMEVEIIEGSDIDIRDDGDGNHKKCVLPE